MDTIVMDNGHIESHDFYNGDYENENYDSNSTDNQSLVNHGQGLLLCMGGILLFNCINQVYLSCKVVIHDIQRQNKIKRIIINDEEEYINNECSICLDRFKKNEIANRLPCSHIFHHNCLKEWFQQNTSCPLCRNIL